MLCMFEPEVDLVFLTYFVNRLCIFLWTVGLTNPFTTLKNVYILFIHESFVCQIKINIDSIHPVFPLENEAVM